MTRGQVPHLPETAQGAIQLLDARPELRDVFPIADALDVSIRAGA